MLIVFEGTDGVGKTTQVDLLEQRLKADGKTVSRWKFPNYQSATGKVITRYLNNEFGDASEVDPYLASALYALDRAAHKTELEEDIEKHDYVILDRYFYSNMALQGAKHVDKAQGIMDFIMTVEGEKIALPEPDKVFLLHMDIGNIIKSLEERPDVSSVASDGKLDGHEKCPALLINATEIYCGLADLLGWNHINCFSDENVRRSAQELSDEIYGNVTDGTDVRSS